MFTRTKSYAQFIRSYKMLSLPEQKWVKRHPIAAFRTHSLADSAKKESFKLLKDKEFDSDLNGGSVDAFKHTLWMALTAQKIGKRKAILLGIAHEDANRLEFDANPNRNNIVQDSIASRMDLLNNEIGASLGVENKDVPYQQMVNIVRDAVLTGKCWKIKKKNKYQYYDSDGNIIKTNDYNGKWAIPKVLIKSNE